MKRFRSILNGNLFIVFIIPALFAFFVIFNKPSYQAQNMGDYDLKVIPLTLQYVGKYYVDDTKVDPGTMLKAGLNRLESSSDEILVQFKDKNSARNFDVQVDNNLKEYRDVDIYDLDSVKDVLQDVFSFAVPLLTNKDIDTDDLEYAVADSMLKTLDPHSGIIVPEIYKEFMIETEGSFGGLGIVIGIRDGQLTVISPIEGTPAYKAGIKTNDKIVQIENESTINMSLVEAVGKLRGKKGTQVSIYVSRKTFNEPRKFTITRDTIKIQSVDHYMLDDNILYLRIRDFQKNTYDGLVKALNNSGNITGVILDLRGNPGGLLDQAEKVSDLFLKSGVVVTTKIGSSKKSYMARSARPEYDGEMVVLVDSGSASASEIVSGALKNNDRAVVIGEKTFGKGSVQQIFDLNGGAALKLTIAGYLTPGDISIQDIGITPDIELQRAVINKENIMYMTDHNKPEGAATKSGPRKPVYKIKYLDTTVNDEGEERTPEEALSDKERLKKLKDDFAVQVGKAVIQSSHNIKRKKSLDDIKNILVGLEKSEDKKIEQKWQTLGVNWSEQQANINKPNLQTTVNPSQVKLNAGETGKVTINVTNKGSQTLYRVIAMTESDNPILDEKEIPFGKIEPGQTRSWTTHFDVPKWAYSRNDKVTLHFNNSSNSNIPDHSFDITTVASNKPSFSYNYEVIDDGRQNTSGNGDSRLEKGENVAILFHLKNTGKGASDKTFVNLKNLSGENIFLDKGRVEFQNLDPGEEKTGTFHFKVNKNSEKFEFELQLLEELFKDGQIKKLTIPGEVKNEEFAKSNSYAITIDDKTPVLGGSFDKAPLIGYAYKNSGFGILLKNDKWVKVKLSDQDSGWIKIDKVYVSDNNIRESKYTPAYNYPPDLKVNTTPLVTDKNTYIIKGTASDSDTIEYISLFNGDDKIGLIAPNENKYDFTFKVKLDEGVNLLNIVAKDKTGLYSKDTTAIRKTSAH